jgi:CheY-like chemotaxis protein
MNDMHMGKATVLVVEDESLLRELIVQELADAGFEVIEADTGERAIAILDADQPIDVLFTDIRLPGPVDGWQIARHARHHRPEIPVIYASGYTVDRSAQVPDSLYLGKPYRTESVVVEIERCLTRTSS